MKYTDVIVSAVTTFVIITTGAIGLVAASNGAQALNKTAWILSVLLGLGAAAKDVRSSLRLPPVPETGGIVPTSVITAASTNNPNANPNR